MNRNEKSITSAQTYINYILEKREIRLPVLPEICVIAHSEAFILFAKQRFPCQSVDIGSRCAAMVHFFSRPDGAGFAVVSAHHGAPMAALFLEELIALGFQRFLTVGPAGYPTTGNSAGLAPGEIVVADGALIYEGTSPHYGSAGTVQADMVLADRLSNLLLKHGVMHRRGKVATTDAIYRETPSFINEIVDRQAVAIDMEVSALYSVCRFHGKSIVAILFISDVVGIDLGWEVAFIDQHVNAAESKIFNLLFEHGHLL